MEDFEAKAINTAEYPPRNLKRYVDDTYVVIDSAQKERFLEHINNIDHTSNLKQRMLKQMSPFPSWTQFCCHSLNIPSLHWCTESPHIHNCTCIGTVITTYLQSSVLLTPLNTGAGRTKVLPGQSKRQY